MVADSYWWREEEWPSDLAPFAILLRAFIDERLSAPEFETLFLVVFRAPHELWPHSVFTVLEEMFFYVDVYTPDPELRDEGDLDETGLRTRAAEALTKLASVKADDGEP